MESGEKERKQLAKESVNWRCPDCGGGGEEEALKLAYEEAQSSGKKEDSEVPAELKLGYKDEMEKKKEPPASSDVPQDRPKNVEVAGTNTLPSSSTTASAAATEPSSSESSSTLIPNTSQQPSIINGNVSTTPTPTIPIQTSQPTITTSSTDADRLLLYAQEQAQTLGQGDPRIVDYYTRAILNNMLLSSPTFPTTASSSFQPYPASTSDAQPTAAYPYYPPTGVPQMNMMSYPYTSPLQPPMGIPVAGAAIGSGEVAAVAAAAPIHTFLHPQQDRGTAWLDIAIGILLGLLSILVLRKV